MFKVLGNGRVRQATDKNANTHNTKLKQQNKIGLERTNASHQCSMPTKEREAKENALDVYSFSLLPSYYQLHALTVLLSVRGKK